MLRQRNEQRVQDGCLVVGRQTLLDLEEQEIDEVDLAEQVVDEVEATHRYPVPCAATDAGGDLRAFARRVLRHAVPVRAASRRRTPAVTSSMRGTPTRASVRPTSTRSTSSIRSIPCSPCAPSANTQGRPARHA